MSDAEVSGTVRIAAPADEIYALVSDVTRMGEWSPENVGGRWLGDIATPVVGARFTGANRRGWRRWSTTCTVTAAEPGRNFAFDVAFNGIPVSRWAYELQPDGEETVVTESWADRRPARFALLVGPFMGMGDIRDFHRENIRQTLANLATAAEGSKA
jgi:hypothetical protein